MSNQKKTTRRAAAKVQANEQETKTEQVEKQEVQEQAPEAPEAVQADAKGGEAEVAPSDPEEAPAEKALSEKKIAVVIGDGDIAKVLAPRLAAMCDVLEDVKYATVEDYAKCCEYWKANINVLNAATPADFAVAVRGIVKLIRDNKELLGSSRVTRAVEFSVEGSIFWQALVKMAEPKFSASTMNFSVAAKVFKDRERIAAQLQQLYSAE